MSSTRVIHSAPASVPQCPGLAAQLYAQCAQPIPQHIADGLSTRGVLLSSTASQSSSLSGNPELLLCELGNTLLAVHQVLLFKQPNVSMAKPVALLIEICLKRCNLDVVVIQNTWFAVGRSQSDVHQDDEYDAATALAFLPLSHFAPSDLSAQEPVRRELEEPVQQSERATLNSVLVAPLDPRLQRCMLAGRMRAPALCVLVVATYGAIYKAMESALHHRSSWNIRGPIVGIAHAGDGCKLQLVVGWSEGQLTSDPPVVHLCHAPFSMEGGLLRDGFFDLADTTHVLVFARMILSLAPHIAVERQAGQVIPPSDIFPWRVDQIDASHQCFERWLQDAREHPPTHIDDSTRPRDFATLDRYIDDAQLAHASVPNLRFRFAEFVCLSQRKFNFLQHWLLDRYAFSHAFMCLDIRAQPDFSQYLGSNLDRSVSIYRWYADVVQFLWPASWMRQDYIPIVPYDLVDLRRELFELGTRAAGTHMGDMVLPAMTTSLAPVLRICALAKASRIASGEACFGSWIGHFEAMMHLLASGSSPDLRLHTGRVQFALPRNDYLDCLSVTGSDARKYSGSVIQRHADQRRAEYTHMDALRHPLIINHSHLATLESSRDDTGRTTLRRAFESPLTGLCDSMLTIDAPWPAELGQCPNFITGQIPSRYPLLFAPKWEGGHSPDNDCTIVETAQAHYPRPDDPPLQAAHAPDAETQGATAGPSGTWNAYGAETHDAPRVSLPVLLTVDGTDPINDEPSPEHENCLRMALTAAAKFLAALEVLEFPVFGLYIRGPLAVVTTAWATRPALDCPVEVNIMEYACAGYDLTSPCGAFSLATVLTRLQQEHAPRLAARFAEGIQDTAARERVAANSARWSAAHQADEEFDLPPDEDSDNDALDEGDSDNDASDEGDSDNASTSE